MKNIHSDPNQLKQLADEGDPEAMYDYGLFLWFENNDPDGALKYLLSIAEQGYAPAYGEVGVILYQYKDDVDGAEYWLEKAVQADCLLPDAAYEYGLLLNYERDNTEDSLKYLITAAEKEFESAYGAIGIILFYQKNDIDGAEYWFKKAVQADCLTPPDAAAYGSLLYLDRNDIIAGEKYLRFSAENDYEPAYGDLAIILYREKNEVDEAEYWFKKSVEADCLTPPVAYEYGLLLIEARKNKKEGLHFLRLAAEEGYEIAEEDLLLYEE